MLNWSLIETEVWISIKIYPVDLVIDRDKDKGFVWTKLTKLFIDRDKDKGFVW